MMKHVAALVLAAAAVPFLAGSALAHGCHHDVEKGYYGWHRHNRHCERISVRPPHHHHQPVCVKKCKYIGPIKKCRVECDD